MVVNLTVATMVVNLTGQVDHVAAKNLLLWPELLCFVVVVVVVVVAVVVVGRRDAR
jgi:hypothetical protein